MTRRTNNIDIVDEDILFNEINSSIRNHINKNPHNLERIVEKYKNLAKEALSVGDKILYENYMQHADHFTRIFAEKENNKTAVEKTTENNNLE